ncbi:MAG: type II CRISPR-associated endonuclease Cas1 [Clostridiales bacterium]|nr:type II CRISPR-associated endonuclease Cas1 [Clostridiales bacterium]
MSFRTVLITKHCKCSYKNGSLVVRGVETKLIHLSEIYCLVIESTAALITSYLINELMKQKIPIIFCDEQHNPCAQVLPFYGSHNTSKRVSLQAKWSEMHKKIVWTKIVHKKIQNQAALLKTLGCPDSALLAEYADNIELADVSNREGHAAKVYFNSLFGKGFSRRDDSYLNAALDYGYSLILSAFNREVVANGYITQLGICHRNEFNEFNLSCDLMEPFRPVIDKKVYSKHPFVFDEDMRYNLVDTLNSKVKLNGANYHLTTAIAIYTRNILRCLSSGKLENLALDLVI